MPATSLGQTLCISAQCREWTANRATPVGANGDALYRFYGRDAFGWPVGWRIICAGGVDREKTERAWAAWLEGLYG